MFGDVYTGLRDLLGVKWQGRSERPPLSVRKMRLWPSAAITGSGCAALPAPHPPQWLIPRAALSNCMQRCCMLQTEVSDKACYCSVLKMVGGKE